mgnify:CR=1 FL=1
MNKYFILLFIILMSAIASCNKPPGSTPPAPSRFHTDSVAIIAKANQFRLEKEYDSAIALLDSTFLLPIQSNQHPDGLSPDDARRLMSYAIRHLMFAYNHSRRITEGHEHFLRLREMNHPILSRHCQREMLVCDAQMLQTLGRRAEACQLLDQAMSIHENNDPSSELFCTIAAGITYMAVDSTETRAEPTLLRAAEAMRNGAYDDTGLYPQAMANLANIYIRKNEFQKGIKLCQEVMEQSDRAQNPRGVMLAAINLCGNYTELSFFDKALHYNDEGLRQFREDNETWGMAASLYERRALIYKRMGLIDSAFSALNLADSFYVRATNPRGQIRVQLEKLDAKAEFPDSLLNALTGFEEIKDKVPGYMQLDYYMGYGKATYLAGRYTEAIPLLEKAVDLSKIRGDWETENHNNRLLLDSYHHTGMMKAAKALLPRYNMIIDSVTHEKSIRESIASHIRYETEKIEQENRLLTADIALRNSVIRTYTIGTIAFILFILLLGTWFWSRHRLASIRLNEKEKELKRIIESRYELHERNQELLRQLTEIQASNQSGGELNKLMETLSPAMLTSKEETEFRVAFSEIYPTALIRLRSACPNITKNEELLCMLILINQTTEEIARILGIASTSVTRIRYRLRPKLTIPEKASLDAEIRRIMKG